MEKKPEIPPDLHDISPEDNNLDNINKTYTKPKVTIVTIPYGVAKVVAENIDVKKVDPKFLLEPSAISEENPWKVENLTKFLYYCCPECEYQDHSKENFIQHASNTHPKSIDCLKKFSKYQKTMTNYKEIPTKVVNLNAKKRRNEERDEIANISKKRIIINPSKNRRIKVEDCSIDVEDNSSDPNDLEQSIVNVQPFHVGENQIESSETVLCQNTISTIKEEPAAMNEKEVLSDFNNKSYDDGNCDVVIKHEIENQIGDTIA